MVQAGVLSTESFVTALEYSQPRLARFCLHMCRDTQAAEDLAQDVMLIAWQRRAQLRERAGMLPWLLAIARNVWRNRVRSRRRAPVLAVLSPKEPAVAVDLAQALEAHELVALLDGALGTLRTEARAVLVLHHVLGLPHAAIAERLGLTEGAVAVRLHRARNALREVVLADPQLREEAQAYGLVPLAHTEWQATRIWCPVCGAQRYVGRFSPTVGELFLRCPTCSPDPTSFSAHTLASSLLRGVVGYRVALNRTAAWAHRFYGKLLSRGAARCVSCGGTVVEHEGRALGTDKRVWQFACRQCAATYDTQALGVVLARPEVRSFWRRHGRIRSLPVQSLALDGRAALLARFEAVAGGQRLEVVVAAQSGALLALEGGI